MWDLIVVGGGAAGLWAAGTAGIRSKRVLVLEKNRKPGVKILMSGGTRCNITHDCDIKGILDAFGNQGRFLKPALYELKPTDVVAEINRLGVPTKTEDTGKVFPVSDRSLDVRDALVRRLQTNACELRSGIAVDEVSRKADGLWQVVVGGTEAILSHKVLICSGGLSYAGCGTTGDGYAWARSAGHSIVETHPALTPLLSPVPWVHQLTGITHADANVQVLLEGSKIRDARSHSRGGFLWTHFGCSGPTAMNVSRFVSHLEPSQQAELQVDLVPDLTEELLRAELTQVGRRVVQTFLNSIVPKAVAATLFERANVNDGTTVAELPRGARQSLITDLKGLRFPLSGTRGYAKAEVTRGGIDTSEVNPKTMESRLAPGLFFAGEILNVDGPIGGYNFQAAFSTGHTAGLNV